MKIGILSDTHDQVERARIAVEALKSRGAEALIHCGDFTTDDVVYECVGIPGYFVFGNCDDDPARLRRAIQIIGGTCLERGGIITLGGRAIAATHGDSAAELRRLERERPDYLFSGHTHVAADEQAGAVRRINPGALHRASFWSVALLDLASNKLDVVRIDHRASSL